MPYKPLNILFDSIKKQGKLSDAHPMDFGLFTIPTDKKFVHHGKKFVHNKLFTKRRISVDLTITKKEEPNWFFFT